MSFRIQHNVMALNANRNLATNHSNLNKSLERLSSGYRINSAADDAAGLASSMRLRAEIASLKVANRNAAEATSMLQVAEGAMSQIDLMLVRMKELATQAASANAGSDLTKIDAEASALEHEITRIIGFTQYDGKNLLDGTFGSVQVSSSSDFSSANGVSYVDVSSAATATTYTVAVSTASGAETMTLTNSSTSVSQTIDISSAMTLTGTSKEILDFDDIGIRIKVGEGFGSAITAGDIDSATTVETTAARGKTTFQLGQLNNTYNQLAIELPDLRLAGLADGSLFDIDLTTQATAQEALSMISDAISKLSMDRATLGAVINRIGYTSSNIAVSIENKTASESIIRDVDMAMEMSTFTKENILVQAGISMVAQANQVPQSVLQLLQ